MSTRFAFCVLAPILASGLLFMTQPAAAGTINAADFGLTEGADATIAIREALAACCDRGADQLVIPKGTYHLHPANASQRYCAISNNDNGMKRIAFPLVGINDFEIDGQGSEFIFHGHMVAFLIEDSQRIKLRNFTIDWAQPFNFQGSIVAVDEENKTIDIEPYEECEVVLKHNDLLFVQREPMTQDGGKLDTWQFPWEQNLRWTIFFDEQTKEPIANHSSAGALSSQMQDLPDYRAEKVGENRYRLHNVCRQYPEPGMALIAKGMLHHNRCSPAICVNKSAGISLEKIYVHHAGGMGLIVERTEDVSLDRFNVCLRPGTKRIISTTADATHFVGCRGAIRIKNCLFENMLDDATNVHGIYTRISRQTGPKSVEAKRMHFQQFGFIFAGPGDRLRFSARETLQPYAEAMVAAVEEVNDQVVAITFEEPLGFLKADSVLDNLSWQADVEMVGCTVRCNRARSILLSTAGKVLIQDNLFDRSSMMNILLEGDAFVWHESGPVTDIQIVGNRFVGLNTSAAAIRIAPKFPEGVVPTEPYHRHVHVLDNAFETRSGFMLDALDAQDVVFRGNTVRDVSGQDRANEQTPLFLLRRCRDVTIEGNVVELGAPRLVRADLRTENVAIRDNRGIEQSVRRP